MKQHFSIEPLTAFFLHSGLTDDELQSIWNAELVDIINTVTAASSTQIQRNVFLFTDQDSVSSLTFDSHFVLLTYCKIVSESL